MRKKRLRINLLGKPKVWLDGERLTNFSTAKTEALLYYLATTGQTHSRETLAGLLWAEMPEAKARRNLTKSLTVLRRLLEPFLIIEAQRVGFDPDVAFASDVTAFTTAVSTPTLSPDTITLYRGDFLEGFFVKDAPAFEEWLLTRREQLREMAISALEALVEQAAKKRAYDIGIAYGRRLLELDPWRESAHRQLMLLLARHGQHTAALAQYEQCRQVLADELGVEPMPETTSLLQRIQLARRNRPYQLPASTTPFVGREAELAMIGERLADPGCRLLTLVGLGGVGKTRLALAAARQANQEQAVEFINGVVFVPLVSLSSADAIPLALADALALPLAGPANPATDVLNFLRDREMLLILDNFEQLLEGTDLLKQILHTCPQIKLLVTSREPLQLAAEWRLNLEGLSYPATEPVDLDAAGLYDASQLFLQAGLQAQPGFELTNDNLRHMYKLCRLVDGLPLALRLAATWLRVMPLADIVAGVERGLDILATTLRDVPVRQRSMHVIFDHAWSLLNQTEKQLFSALSIFHSSFSAAAMTQITGAKPMLVAGLVDRGLLQLASPEGRYALHELTRQYAAVKLAETQSQSDFGRRHSTYYLHLVAEHAPAVFSATPQAAITLFKRDLDNIRQAWQWALQSDLDLLNQSLDPLADFYEATSLLAEGEQTFASAAAELAEATAAAQQALICRLLAKAAEFAELRGDYEQARARAERVMTLAKGSARPHYLADAYRTLGIVARWAGQPEQAIAHLRQAGATYQSLGMKRQMASAYDWLGLVLSDQREVDEALVILQEAADLHAAAGNARGEVFNRGMTAIVYGVMVRLRESLTYHQDVLRHYQQIDYPLGISRTLNNIGTTYHELGEYELAIPLFEEAFQIARQIGLLPDAYNSLGNKGETQMALGHYNDALRCLQQVQRYFQDADATFLEAENLWRLGQLYLEMGEYQQARETLDHCLAIASDDEVFAFGHSLLGQLLQREGNDEQALVYFDKAIAAFQRVRRVLALAAFAYLAKATLLLERSQVAEAEAVLNQVEPLLEGAGRNGIVFASQHLRARIAFAHGRSATATAQLVQLLSQNLRRHEIAAVHYSLWQFSDDPGHGQKALEQYQVLAQETPNVLYRQRFRELHVALEDVAQYLNSPAHSS